LMYNEIINPSIERGKEEDKMKRIMRCIALLLALAVSAAAEGSGAPMVVTLEWKEYEMPCSVSELVNDGWTLYDAESWREAYWDEDVEKVDLSQKLAPGEPEKECVLVHWDGKEVMACVKNLTAEAAAISACQVVLLAVTNEDEGYRDLWLQRPARLEYEGIVSGETTYNTLPDWAEGYEHWIAHDVYAGQYDAESGYAYAASAPFNWEDTDAPLRTLIAEADYPELYRPDSLVGERGGSQTPDDDWTSGTVMLDGKVYRMPIPIGELLEDGWAADVKLIRPFREAEQRGYLVKDGKKVSACVYFGECMDEYFWSGDERYPGGDQYAWMEGDVVSLSCPDDGSVDFRTGPFYIGMTVEEMVEVCRTRYGGVPEFHETSNNEYRYIWLYARDGKGYVTYPLDAQEEGVDVCVELWVNESGVINILESYEGAYWVGY